jgi:hypothetical protein
VRLRRPARRGPSEGGGGLGLTNQVPENIVNNYAPPSRGLPVHLCSASSQFDYRPAYNTMVGGALLMTSEQFERVNGFAAQYWGWGLEDDDMFYRIDHTFKAIDRIPPHIGRYKALAHPRVMGLDETKLYWKGRERMEAMSRGAFDFMTDGLNSVKYSVISTRREGDVLHVLSDLRYEKMPKTLKDDI